MRARRVSLYRPAGVALLRASAAPVADAPVRWPDLEDAEDCRVWLGEVWPGCAEAVGLASSALAARVEQILSAHPVPGRRVCRAAATVARYLLRAVGRPTPFALFAGVAPAEFGAQASLEFGLCHRSQARADAAWLDGVIGDCEAGPLLAHLEVTFNDLAMVRGGRLCLPRAEGRVEIRHSAGVRAVRQAARTPVNFADLADYLAEGFPATSNECITGMLQRLVEHGFLTTCLRAPMTETDPLGHLVVALHAAGADKLASTAPLLAKLGEIHADIRHHNLLPDIAAQSRPRAAMAAQMDRIRPQGRSPLAVDLAVDCALRLPETVAADMAAAASVLTRLGASVLGPSAWADYHRRFVERYGTGTCVRLADVLDPTSGLGYPAGYSGSVFRASVEGATARDRRLLALAWRAIASGGRRLEVTDAVIEEVTSGDLFDERYIQPHVEIAARIRAASPDALRSGGYVLAVTPARSIGTLSARFQHVTGDTAMERVYRKVPVLYEGALPVQLCCPPLFVRGQNVARIPALLPDLLTLGEPPMPEGVQRVLNVEDLAVTATGHGLLLLEKDTDQIIEPQVFHALALDHQMPPLARFLAHLPRAYAAGYTAFDWGTAAAELPHLPEVRYGRTVLSPERWKLDAAKLPGPRATAAQWRSALDDWRRHISCPAAVELVDGDMTLRLDLTERAHTAILREHLAEKHSAILNQAFCDGDYGWIGHAHELVLPLVRSGPPAPSKLPRLLPKVTNVDGHHPGTSNSAWLCARIHTHPDIMNEIIADHLPKLRRAVAEAPTWMVRYRNPEETDHLRIRIRTTNPAESAEHFAALGAWTDGLHAAGLTGRLLLDTYYPEVGRYGSGAAMAAAEDVFCADTQAAIATLRGPPSDLHPDALTALAMLDIAEAFLSSMDQAAACLTGRTFRQSQPIDRAAATATTRLARRGVPRLLPQLPADLALAWTKRAEALATYRAALPPQADTAAVLQALLHLHYNRHRWINREHEGACLRLARSAAIAWRTTKQKVAP